MPTDLLTVKNRRDAAHKREMRDTTFVLLLLSLGGAFFTILRAVQSDAFELALVAMGAVE